MAAVAAMLEEHVVISCPRARGRVDAWSGPRLIRTCVQVHARVAVDANPQDYGALAKWGELLLELAMTKEGDEATAKLLESIDKLEQSLKIFPDNSHAMVVLASALNARAFLQQDPDVAAGLFERSKKNFERALELDPSNSRCRQLLEAMENAPALHAQVLSLQPPPPITLPRFVLFLTLALT